MTPTPAETALWWALNPRPTDNTPAGLGLTPYGHWCRKQEAFNASHPADRLAYFEGKVREHYPRVSISRTVNFLGEVVWVVTIPDECGTFLPSGIAPTEHLARFHASASALAALGVITDDVMKEIDDALAA